MIRVTKEDVRNAYLLKQGKRSRLLYEYYKEEFFEKKYSASFIADKISDDLGVTVTTAMIYSIFDRIIKKKKVVAPNQSLEVSDQALEHSPQTQPSFTRELPGQELEKPLKEYNFLNTDKLPKGNRFDGLFDE